jgi:hypothetical protein
MILVLSPGTRSPLRIHNIANATGSFTLDFRQDVADVSVISLRAFAVLSIDGGIARTVLAAGDALFDREVLPGTAASFPHGVLSHVASVPAAAYRATWKFRAMIAFHDETVRRGIPRVLSLHIDN